MILGPRKHYKSIDFDLDTNLLQDYYSDYRQAYKKLGTFMKQHGFTHRQGSVYNSTNKLLESDIIDLVDDLKHTFAWASTCIEAFDVTNISHQHSMLAQLRANDEELDLDIEPIVQENNNDL